MRFRIGQSGALHRRVACWNFGCSTLERLPVNFIALMNLPIVVTALVAGLSSLAYLAVRLRGGQRHFRLIDAAIMVVLMTIGSAAAVPFLKSKAQGAMDSVVLDNLYTLRSQIALYKMDHRGDAPIFYQGTLPQLTQATNAEGVPGAPGNEQPFGPYFCKGLPANPVTGRTTVTLTDTFPPMVASGNGGWLYHQKTGQIAIDSPELLNR